MDGVTKSQVFKLFSEKKPLEEIKLLAGISLEDAKKLKEEFVPLIGHPEEKRAAFEYSYDLTGQGSKPQRILEHFAGGQKPGEGGGMTRVFENLARRNAQTSIRSYYDSDGEATDVCRGLIDRGDLSFTIIDLDVFGNWTLYNMFKTGVLKLADPSGCMVILTVADRARTGGRGTGPEHFKELIDVVGSRGENEWGDPMGPCPSQFVVYVRELAEKLGLSCEQLHSVEFEKATPWSWVMNRIHLWVQKKPA